MILDWEVCDECGGDLPPRGRCSYCTADQKREKVRAARFVPLSDDDELGDALE